MVRSFRGISPINGVWYQYSAVRTVQYFVTVGPTVPQCVVFRKYRTDRTGPDECDTTLILRDKIESIMRIVEI